MSSSHSPAILPQAEELERARAQLITSFPQTGLGDDHIHEHLEKHIVPGLNLASRSANYYGFVTGGATIAASIADHIVTDYDQNVQVHLPDETIATDVEDAALRMVCDLARLPESQWLHRTFTTGATASNVVGLACGREYIVRTAAQNQGKNVSVAEDGIVHALHALGVDSIQILTTVPHSSLRKAASIVGLGRASFIDVGQKSASHRFDFATLESALDTPHTLSIVVVSCAEVNTGFFATSGDDMRRLRTLCDKYNSWLHVDAAFGLQARILDETASEFGNVIDGVRGLELADSITGDAHKLLNVPYDCGIFLSRHLDIGTDVFQNANAAYLNSGSAGATNVRVIPSPLNISIENSRRFRALPVYSTLVAYGQAGYRDILHRQIGLSRAIARFIMHEPRLELLPQRNEGESDDEVLARIYVVVLFRAEDVDKNRNLVRSINQSRQIYVSPTAWEGSPAARFAVSNWQVNIKPDLEKIKNVVLEMLQSDL